MIDPNNFEKEYKEASEQDFESFSDMVEFVKQYNPQYESPPLDDILDELYIKYGDGQRKGHSESNT